MAFGHMVRYLGDEVLTNVPTADPDLPKYNRLKDKPFSHFIEHPDDEAFLKDYLKRKQNFNIEVVVDRDGNPIRRFPHVEEDGEKRYTDKRAPTNDVFRHTGLFAPNGDPIYVGMGVTDIAFAQLRNIRTQQSNMAMYVEITEEELDEFREKPATTPKKKGGKKTTGDEVPPEE